MLYSELIPDNRFSNDGSYLMITSDEYDHLVGSDLSFDLTNKFKLNCNLYSKGFSYGAWLDSCSFEESELICKTVLSFYNS